MSHGGFAARGISYTVALYRISPPACTTATCLAVTNALSRFSRVSEEVRTPRRRVSRDTPAAPARTIKSAMVPASGTSWTRYSSHFGKDGVGMEVSTIHPRRSWAITACRPLWRNEDNGGAAQHVPRG